MFREMDYGKFEELKKELLFKKIKEWDETKLILDDDTVVTIAMTDWDCCASAGGEFKNVELDAVITNVEIGEIKNVPDDDTIINEVTVTLFHNQNPIAQAEAYADAGNGGFYYSVASLVVKGINYEIVDA